MFIVTYDFSQLVGGKWITYSGNRVGQYDGVPIGYGPIGPACPYRPEDIPEIVAVLTEQLATVPTIHMYPDLPPRE